MWVLPLTYINYVVYFIWAALKIMPPMILCLSIISEADVGDVAVETEPSGQYSIAFCCCAADGSRGAV